MPAIVARWHVGSRSACRPGSAPSRRSCRARRAPRCAAPRPTFLRRDVAVMVALGVVAFRDGGVAAVGVVTAVRMVPAALLAPFAATLADRVRRERVLAWIGLIRAATLGSAAALLRPRRAGGRRVMPGHRGHGRADALPSRALRATACALRVSAAADERERGARHARLARHARRSAGCGGAAGDERTGRRVRRVRRRVAVGRAARHLAAVRPAATGPALRRHRRPRSAAGLRDDRGRSQTSGSSRASRPRRRSRAAA